LDETAPQIVYLILPPGFVVNAPQPALVKMAETETAPMQEQKKPFKFRRGVTWLLVATTATFAGCAAFDPQGTAQAYAPSYYNAPYSSLDPEQKMQLEDHLANQSNQAWRTTALVGSAVGRLAQGTGILLFAARH